MIGKSSCRDCCFHINHDCEQVTDYAGCNKNMSLEMAPATGLSINGEFKVKGLGTVTWMFHLAAQTSLTSRNRDYLTEWCFGNPSHEPSYES